MNASTNIAQAFNAGAGMNVPLSGILGISIFFLIVFIFLTILLQAMRKEVRETKQNSADTTIHLVVIVASAAVVMIFFALMIF